MIRAIAVTSLDGFIDDPMSIDQGGWTSSEDKAVFWSILELHDVTVFGRKTFEGMPQALRDMAYDRSLVTIATRSSPTPLDFMVREASGHGLDVLVCGGYEVYRSLSGLIQEWKLTVEPIMRRSGSRPPLRLPPGTWQKRWSRTLNKRGTEFVTLVRRDDELSIARAIGQGFHGLDGNACPDCGAIMQGPPRCMVCPECGYQEGCS